MVGHTPHAVHRSVWWHCSVPGHVLPQHGRPGTESCVEGTTKWYVAHSSSKRCRGDMVLVSWAGMHNRGGSGSRKGSA